MAILLLIFLLVYLVLPMSDVDKNCYIYWTYLGANTVNRFQVYKSSYKTLIKCASFHFRFGSPMQVLPHEYIVNIQQTNLNLPWKLYWEICSRNSVCLMVHDCPPQGAMQTFFFYYCCLCLIFLSVLSQIISVLEKIHKGLRRN